MSDPLVVIDADVLGRHRTGDETYVENLLRALPAVGSGLRFAAITRHPELVPPGIEPIALPARVQELRMAVRVPFAGSTLVRVPGSGHSDEMLKSLLTLSDVMATGHHAAVSAGVCA